MKNTLGNLKKQYQIILFWVVIIAFILPTNAVSSWVIFLCATIVVVVETRRKYFKTPQEQYDVY